MALSSDPTSHAGRSDVDAPLEAKEAFIDYYLDLPDHPSQDGLKIAGLNIDYLGGIRYELVEMQLSDQSGDDHYYLRMRASGTEPINRIYIEAADLQVGQRMMAEVLKKLEDITANTLRNAHSEWHLVDMLCQSRLSEHTQQAVREVISKQQWSKAEILAKINQMTQILEKRNRKVIQAWYKTLSA